LQPSNCLLPSPALCWSFPQKDTMVWCIVHYNKQMFF
jgi:hypothetical protein